MKLPTRRLKAGEWVEVRCKEEILRTLDNKGQLDGMPFMPEMFAYCGMRFQVYKRSHKTCDTVFPVRGRRVERAVHLETRCSGEAHGGCQAGCLLFWKEAWLQPVDPATVRQPAGASAAPPATCSESDVWDNTAVSTPNEPTVYSCQATRLPYFTSQLPWWDLRQYLEDYTSGNVTLWRIFCGLVYSAYFSLSQAGIGLGKPLRWFYDTFRFLWKGSRFPRHTGSIPMGEPTPTVSLNLQPGELVRVKSHEEILKTLNVDSKNRGMNWDAELVPYCGTTQRVLRRVTRIINEQTGQMQEMKNPCIILESVFCQSRYSACRMFCPRAIFSWWREVWLERVDPQSLTPG